MRGSQASALVSVRRSGSIPACAGEPPLPSNITGSTRVYPRVCGGAISATWPILGLRGLSPRVRGSRDRRNFGTEWVGSIPACAGEPATGRLIIISGEVYPRVCGGATLARAGTSARAGLSPRVRGSLGIGWRKRGCVGSIPACAGEPASARLIPVSRRVYPRVCGGAWSGRSGTTKATGLSPRVRGSPWRRPPSLRFSRVYPRVCGGARVLAGRNPIGLGLSPRVRGSRCRNRS